MSSRFSRKHYEKFRRATLATAGVAVVAVTAAACAGSVFGGESSTGGGNGDPIKIGVAIDQTASLANYDSAFAAGLKLAVDDANAAGGVSGRSIQLITQDMANDPQKEVQAFENLNTQQNAFAFVAGASSQGAAALDPLLTNEKKVALTDTTLAPGTKSIYSYSFNLKLASDYLLSYLKKENIAKIGIIQDGTPYNTNYLKVLNPLFAQNGITVTGTQQHAPDITDLRSQVQSLLGGGPQAIVKLSAGSSDIVAAKAMTQDGATIPLLGTTSTPSTAQQTADAYTGYRYLAWPVQLADTLPNPPDTLKKFISEFHSKDLDTGYASVGWDVGNHLVLALKSMKTLDPSALGAAIQALPRYVGAAATYDFSGGPGTGVTVSPYQFAVIKDGKTQLAP